MPPRMPGDEVRAHQLVDEAERADAEQQRRDVRVRQQVEERLERVHREVLGRRAGEVQRDRLAVDRDLAPVGKGEHVVE